VARKSGRLIPEAQNPAEHKGVQDQPLLYFELTDQVARILNTDDLAWTAPYGPWIVAKLFADIASEWVKGLI
jgi:hypothetical protein